MGATTSTVAKAPASESEELVKLRYLGSSGQLVDDQTSMTFTAHGDLHKVPAADAARLEALPYEQFERVN